MIADAPDSGGPGSLSAADRTRLRVYPWLFIVGYLVIGGVLILGGSGLHDRNGKPVGGDFVSFYAASTWVRQGQGAAAYDLEKQGARERAIVGASDAEFVTSFFYPPPVLVGVAPLSVLPYGVALALWLVFSVAVYVATLLRFAPARAVLAPALAFPGLFQNVIQGQNGCLSLALVGMGLWLLES